MKDINTKGFTLVELSIVLVIIGLLVSGILVAQSLIDSAKLNSFVSQMQQIETAKDLFANKYRALPGDNDIFRNASRRSGGPFVPVKGDSYLCDDDCAQNTWWSNSEMGNFFLELNKMENIRFDNCPDFDINTLFRMESSGNLCNIPLASMGESAMIFVGGTSFANKTNYYFMGDCKDLTGVGFFNSANNDAECLTSYTGAEALSYDLKVDDGIATTGIVLSSTDGFGRSGGWSLGAAVAERDGDQDVAGAQGNYNVSSSELTHNLMQLMVNN